MLSIHGLIKARLAMVRRQLDQVISRFTDDEFHWRPADGMMTVGGQLLEIADKDRESVIWMKTGAWPDDEPPSFELETANFDIARKALEGIRATTLTYIDSMTEEELELPVHS